MLYKEDWGIAKKRLEALWHNEIVDRCCIAVQGKKDKGVVYEEAPHTPEELYQYYMDPEWLLRRNIKKFENTYYAGDGYPCIWSNFGAAGHAKYFKGAKYRFERDTVWIGGAFKDFEKDMLEYDQMSSILKQELETVQYLCKEGMGKFFVTMPDNCGILDGLAALHGSEDLAMDLFDYPDEIKLACDKIFETYKVTSDMFFDAIYKNNQNGSTHGWMYTWSEGKHAQLQVDFSVMISPQMYEEFALPELVKSCNWLDKATYHLDGEQQVRHLDMILSVDRLNMIQWTPVAGQPKTSHFISTFKKIQAAGKGLILYPELDEVETLLTELSSKGLYLIVKEEVSCDEADRLVDLAAKLTHE